jgi:chemotaxis protein MotB
MWKWLASLVLLVCAALAAAYFWLYRPQEARLGQVARQAADCAAESQRLRSTIADLEAVRDEFRKASAELSDKVAQKESELASLRSTQDDLVGELKQEIADQRIEVERIRGKLRVEMVDEILFESGEANLKPEGIAVLRKIGGVLARAKDQGIEVQGHTDNAAIRGALAKRFATNWELSAARATNVARFLQDEAKLDPTHLSATAFSEFQPRAANDTDQGRRKNRRIEIMLVPLGRTAPAAVGGAQPGATPTSTASPAGDKLSPDLPVKTP